MGWMVRSKYFGAGGGPLSQPAAAARKMTRAMALLRFIAGHLLAKRGQLALGLDAMAGVSEEASVVDTGARRGTAGGVHAGEGRLGVGRATGAGEDDGGGGVRLGPHGIERGRLAVAHE